MMHRKLKQISHVRLYSCWLKRVVVLFLVVLQQGCWGWDWLKRKPSVPVENSKKTISSEQKSSNHGQQNSDKFKTNNTLEEEDILEEQSAKAEKELWDEFKVLSGPSQEKKVQELNQSEAKGLLKWVIKKGKLKLLKTLLQCKSLKAQDLASAIDLIVSLHKQSREVLKMLNLLFRQPILSLNDLRLENSNGNTLVHRSIAFLDIDTWKIILNRSSLDSLCLKDSKGRTLLHCLALLKKTKKFDMLVQEILNKQLNELRFEHKVISKLFEKDNSGCSVIDCSYLPEDSNSQTVRNNNKVKSWISSMKGKKMFRYILCDLSIRLSDEQLTTIVHGIQLRVTRQEISQEYADELYSILNGYIKAKYGSGAKSVIQFVSDAKDRSYADREQFSGMQTLGDAIERNDLEVVKSFVSCSNLDLKGLLMQNDDELGFLHFAAWCKHKEIYKALFDIMYKLDPKRVLDELFRKDAKYRCSVFEFSYNPKYREINRRVARSLEEVQDEAIKMFEFVLETLPVSLDKDQLADIAQEISNRAAHWSTNQEYLSTLRTALEDYIKKKYGDEAGKIIGYVMSKSDSAGKWKVAAAG